MSFAYLECSEMDDTIDIRVVIEDLVEGSFIADVDVVEVRTAAANQFDTIQGFFR